MSAETAADPHLPGHGAGGRLYASARAVGSMAPLLPAIVILIAAVAWGSVTSPYFLDPDSLLLHTGRYVEIGLLALALTVVIINGDIDLSVASNMALSAAVLGLAYQSGLPITVACLMALATGLLLGAINGILVTVPGLPSLVVTLATLALYRGAAQVLLGDSSVTNYPENFVGADQIGLLGTSPDIPLPLGVLLVLATAFWFILQRSDYGLRCYLTGSNQAATRFSGISTSRTRFWAFCLSGLMAGTAAILITSRLDSTRSNLGVGMELLAITVVVLGGTDILGGRGSILGTLVALFAVMAVREALAIGNVNGQTQDAAIGFILVAAIFIPRAFAKGRRRVLRHRLRAGARSAIPASTGHIE